MHKTALILMLPLVPFCVALPVSAAFAAEDAETDTIGPWQIEAVFKGDTFDRCSISRKLDDDIVATFVKTGDDLTLELSSPNWKLDRGKSYPVKMALGPKSFDEEVTAEASSVSFPVKDDKFTAALRSANALNVVGAGATIRVPLDRSSDAFDRLDQCVTKNERAVESNPFVAPARRP
ncbi:MAG: hypothetical protein ACM3MH_07620 [Actinomycetota bacterium]